MLTVDLYQYILLFLVTVLTYNQCNRYRVVHFDLSLSNGLRPDIIGLALCILFTFLIGFRPMEGTAWQWGDSSMYQHAYNLNEGLPFSFDFHTTNFIWDNLFNFWASLKLGLSSLFLVADAIYFGCTYVVCKKWFPHDVTITYLAFLGAFSTYSYSYNGVKAGVAGALFLVAVAYYERKCFSILFLILSLGFHHSMQMPIAAYVLTLFYKNPKWYFYGWVFCAAMAVLHVGFFQALFAGIGSGDEQNTYLTAEQDDATYMTGFRPDFLLYSAVPVWIGYKLVIKEKRKVSKYYLTLLHMYLCTNGIWMLCMYASYTNRIAYLSWFMYPFVLIYPFLKEDLSGFYFLKETNQYRMFAKVVMYHLYFTLFMNIIYYKFIHA